MPQFISRAPVAIRIAEKQNLMQKNSREVTLSTGYMLGRCASMTNESIKECNFRSSQYIFIIYDTIFTKNRSYLLCACDDRLRHSTIYFWQLSQCHVSTLAVEFAVASCMGLPVWYLSCWLRCFHSPE